VLLGILAVGIPLGIGLSQTHERLASSNGATWPSATAATLRAGRTTCQTEAYVPRDAASVQLYAGTNGAAGPPLSVRIAQDGRTLQQSTVRGGYGTETVELALRGRAPADRPARVCIRNDGEVPVLFARADAFGFGPLRVAGATDPRIRLDFLRPGRETGWEIAPAVVDRAARMKGGLVTPVTLWLGLGAVLLAGAAAVRLVLRAGRV
jgi:hypothetical protein